MSSDSDVEMEEVPEKKQKAPPKKKPPPLEVITEKDERKLTTKQMIFNALTELKSRKGTSLYAIKKYIVENYNVDVAKINYLIKKNLKAGVEEGAIVQTKGAGASGSFRLVPGKDKPVKKKTSEKKEKTEKSEKPEKSKPEKAKPEKAAKVKKMSEKAEKPKKAVKIPKNAEKEEKESGKMKEKSSKVANRILKTPSKKASMMKRKSIGSIIKAPKMKPQGKKLQK